MYSRVAFCRIDVTATTKQFSTRGSYSSPGHAAKINAALGTRARREPGLPTVTLTLLNFQLENRGQIVTDADSFSCIAYIHT
jgi:hypothetical protein